jgi:uncharacterized protein (TIGR03437 family)
MRSGLLAIVLLVSAVTAPAQMYSLQTFAGGSLPENVAAVSASLGAISGVAVDPRGPVYLSLADYRIVLRLDPATGMLARVPAGPLVTPMGLAVDAVGRLFITDSGAPRVCRVANGTAEDVAASFEGPFAVAADPSGSLYIADFYNHVIRKVSNGAVTTFAGNGEYGFGGENVAATAAPLAGPSGIAIDSAGNLYIAEAYNNRVRKVSNGVVTTVAGTGVAGFSGDRAPALAATLRQPSDVAVDPGGNLYIADFGNNRIRMVAPTGIITTFAGNGTLASTGDQGAAAGAGLAAPRRIAIDAEGSLYIADGMRVRKIAKGTISTVAGGGTPAGENGPALSAQLLTPQSLAFDPAGNLYLSDFGTARVLKIVGGVLTRVAGTGSPATAPETGSATATPLTGPSGVAVDAAGAVYVADTAAARIRKIDGGTVTTFAGGGPSFGDNGPANKAQLTAPEGLAINPAGVLFLADGNRIRAVSDGTISTAAGNGSVGFQGDNAVATAARLSSPAGVAVDPAGNLLIADTGNNRIRIVSNGVITTVPGSTSLSAPVAVAADAGGDLYASDATRVVKISKGKLTALAGLEGPQGIAVDASGAVYVADPVNHRVVVLNPAGASCAVTLTPGAVASSSSGGPVEISLQTGVNCPWTVDALPSWIALSRASYGVGSAALTFQLAPNPDVPRSATLVVGAQSLTINQAGVATLSGIVTLSTTGKPLPGVNISISGAAPVGTDAGGNYAVANLPSIGPYVVTPSLPGYSFVPASITLATLSATPTANFVAWRRPKIAALTPMTYAPGQIVTIYGEDLCGPSTAAVPTLPDRLASCIVRVDNTAIRVYYASLGQINAVLPQSLAIGPHQVTVHRYTTTAYSQLAAQSDPLPFMVGRIGLSIFQVVQSGDVAIIYGTGLGRKAQTFAEGSAPGRTSDGQEALRITVNGQPATILYAGVQPQYPGLDQINVRIPVSTRPAAMEITAVSTGQVVGYTLR